MQNPQLAVIRSSLHSTSARYSDLASLRLPSSRLPSDIFGRCSTLQRRYRGGITPRFPESNVEYLVHLNYTAVQENCQGELMPSQSRQDGTEAAFPDR